MNLLSIRLFTPIIALISPYEDLREDLKSISNVKEIYVYTSQIRGRESYFAENYSSPKSNFLDLSTDGDLSSCIEKIIEYLND